MPLLDTFRIEINDDKVFNAGQLVSGKVILKTTDHAPFAGVWIEFFGRAIVDESFKLFPCRSKGNVHLQRHDKLTGKSQLYFKIRKHLTGISAKLRLIVLQLILSSLHLFIRINIDMISNM